MLKNLFILIHRDFVRKFAIDHWKVIGQEFGCSKACWNIALENYLFYKHLVVILA